MLKHVTRIVKKMCWFDTDSLLNLKDLGEEEKRREGGREGERGGEGK